METQQLHRGRLIDHVHLVVADLPASRRFYEAIFKVLEMPIGGSEGDYFWVDELFVSTADSQAAQGQLTGRHHLAFQAKDRAMVDAFHAAGLSGGGKDNGAPGERPLSSRLLRGLPHRSGRQQYRSRLSRRGEAQRAFGRDHVLEPYA
jgi:catechol 2,3-dioxygenase-like lactoylglutathione lyase family enzyme